MAFIFPKIKQKNTLNFIERIRLKLEELFRKRKKIKSRSIYYLQRRARNEELTSTIKLKTGRFGFFSRWKKLKSFYKKRLVIRRFLLKTITGFSNKKFRNIFKGTKKGRNTILNSWYLKLACRLDVSLVKLRLIPTIALAQYFIKTNRIFVNNRIINFPDYIINNKDIIFIKPFTSNWRNLYSKLFEKKFKSKLSKIIKADNLILANKHLTPKPSIKLLKLKLQHRKWKDRKNRKNRYYLYNYTEKIKAFNLKIKQDNYWTRVNSFYGNSYINAAFKAKFIKNKLNLKRRLIVKIPQLLTSVKLKKVNNSRFKFISAEIKNYLTKIKSKMNKKWSIYARPKKTTSKHYMNNLKSNIKHDRNINKLNKTVRYYSNTSLISMKTNSVCFHNRKSFLLDISKFSYKKKLKFKNKSKINNTLNRTQTWKNSLLNKFWYFENLQNILSKRIFNLKKRYLNLNTKIRRINQSSKLRSKLRLRRYLNKLYKKEQRYKKLVLKPKKLDFEIHIKKENKFNTKINYMVKKDIKIKETSKLILPKKVVKNLTSLRLNIIKSNILNRKKVYIILQKKFKAKKNKLIDKVKLFGKFRLKWKFLTKRHIFLKIRKLRCNYQRSQAKTLILKKKIENKNHFLFKKKWKNLNFGRLFKDKFYTKKLLGFTNDWTRKIKFSFNSNYLKKV